MDLVLTLQKKLLRVMSKENILITGGGGREHALGWKLNQSPNSGNIFFTPSNVAQTPLALLFQLTCRIPHQH